MKKVINAHANEVSVENCSEDFFYGISKGFRFFVTREQFEGGKFVVRCLSNLTRGNGNSALERDSLKELLSNAIKNRFDVFEFETAEELMKWVLNEK
jgi:hypothetical protein